MEAMIRLVTQQAGIQHAEEALLLALVATALVAAAQTFGNSISASFGSSAAKVAASIQS